MKRQYQIEQQRAVRQFRRIVTEQNPDLQMILPLADIVGMLQQGVGNLLRETGLALMQTVMEEEVRHIAGERHQQHAGRRAHRWGKEDRYCIVDGQKVPIQKTRLRTPDKREQRLGSYELFQRSGSLQAGVWDNKMMRGLSIACHGFTYFGEKSRKASAIVPNSLSVVTDPIGLEATPSPHHQRCFW